MGGSDDDDNASATTTTTTAASILETTSLQLNISKLHSDLSRASEGNADLHARMEALHREKIKAFSELQAALEIASAEGVKRRAAEQEVARLASDLKSLTDTDETAALFSEIEARRAEAEEEVYSLKVLLAEAMQARTKEQQQQQQQ